MSEKSSTSTRTPGIRRGDEPTARRPNRKAPPPLNEVVDLEAEEEQQISEADAQATESTNGGEGEDRSSEGDIPRPNIQRLRALLESPFAIRSLMITGIFVIALIFILWFAREVLVPVTLAMVLSFLLAPPVAWLHRLGIPDAVGAGLVLLVLLAVVGYGMYRITVPAIGWMESLPEQLQGIEAKLRDISGPIERMSEAAEEIDRVTGGAAENEEPPPEERPEGFEAFVDEPPEEARAEQEAEQSEQPVQVEVREPTFSQTIMTEARGFIAGTVIVFILLYFLLAAGDLFLVKLVKVQPNLMDKKRAVDIVRQIKQDTSIYLSTITAINIGLGIATGFAMYLMGMPNPFLWGVMATLLNYIPYVGAIAGTAVVGLVAIATFDEPRTIVMTPLVYWLLTALEGYLVTPLVLGRRLTLNPVVIFLGLVFWGWLWGIPGALLAVPLLAMFKILCDRIEPLQPIGEFLGR